MIIGFEVFSTLFYSMSPSKYAFIMHVKIISMYEGSGERSFNIAGEDWNLMVEEKLINGITNRLVHESRITVEIDSSIASGQLIIKNSKTTRL